MIIFFRLFNTMNIFIQQSVQNRLLKLIPSTVQSYNFFNIINFQSLNLFSQLQKMMSSYNNLKQFKVTLYKAEFIVFNLLELIQLQIIEASIKYQLKTKILRELQQLEYLIGLDVFKYVLLNQSCQGLGSQKIRHIQKS